MELITADANLVFTAALVLMVLIALFEGLALLLGMGFSHILDTLLPDIHVDVDYPDISTHQGSRQDPRLDARWASTRSHHLDCDADNVWSDGSVPSVDVRRTVRLDVAWSHRMAARLVVYVPGCSGIHGVVEPGAASPARDHPRQYEHAATGSAPRSGSCADHPRPDACGRIGRVLCARAANRGVHCGRPFSYCAFRQAFSSCNC